VCEALCLENRVIILRSDEIINNGMKILIIQES
jgi:hypothetical protein